MKHVAKLALWECRYRSDVVLYDLLVLFTLHILKNVHFNTIDGKVATIRAIINNSNNFKEFSVKSDKFVKVHARILYDTNSIIDEIEELFESDKEDDSIYNETVINDSSRSHIRRSGYIHVKTADILFLLYSGASITDIARELRCTRETVKYRLRKCDTKQRSITCQ